MSLASPGTAIHPSSEEPPPHPPRRPRLKGVLALLPACEDDDAMMTLYPYDKRQWQEQTTVRRRIKTSKKSVANTKQQVQRLSLSDLLLATPNMSGHEDSPPEAAVSIVAILVLDPYQTHSLLLLEKMVQICQFDDSIDKKLQLLVVSQRSDVSLDALLLYSGAAVVPFDETFGWWAVTACGVTACPAVVVVECDKGRKISGSAEVVAVEGSSVEQVRTQWLERQTTAATALQAVQAAVCVIS